MEGLTYKGREGRGKGEREVPPVITVPPGPRGARIVTVCRCVGCQKCIPPGTFPLEDVQNLILFNWDKPRKFDADLSTGLCVILQKYKQISELNRHHLLRCRR